MGQLGGDGKDSVTGGGWVDKGGGGALEGGRRGLPSLSDSASKDLFDSAWYLFNFT